MQTVCGQRSFGAIPSDDGCTNCRQSVETCVLEFSWRGCAPRRNGPSVSYKPGLQFYSGNFFDGSTKGKAGKSYHMGDAIALEPQMFPDAPNQGSFASVALYPDQTYENVIIWQFGVTAGDADEHPPQ